MIRKIELSFGLDLEGKGKCSYAKIIDANEEETLTREIFIPKTDGKGKEKILKLISDNL